tara:strand:- start:1022 stop:1222 length:201 start_codon:yes stop_codon:yes gene_type:complete
MELNEIKKALYKQKPIAKLQQKSAGYLNYTTKLENGFYCLFVIPNKEAENFEEEMDAKLLIRWLRA